MVLLGINTVVFRNSTSVPLMAHNRSIFKRLLLITRLYIQDTDMCKDQ